MRNNFRMMLLSGRYDTKGTDEPFHRRGPKIGIVRELIRKVLVGGIMCDV